MIKKRLSILKDQLKQYGLDGYIVPKNDEFFSEYSDKDRLKVISNFTGSAGYAVILKDKNYLFVDGRYTIQAKIECGENFKIIDYKRLFNLNIFKNLNLGIDPKLITSLQIKNFFSRHNNVRLIEKNLIDNIFKFKSNKLIPFYSLSEKITGENHQKKIKKISKYLRDKKIDLMFVSAPENVAWLLNIRGHDDPSSPIPNCRLIISKKNEIYLISNKKKSLNLLKEKKLTKKQIIEPKRVQEFFNKIKGKNISIDKKTCSIYFEKNLSEHFEIIKREDPIYLHKSIKNKVEINNMINAHILDGVALTKFIYWLKNKNKSKITEVDAQNKLEKFRKINSKYLFPSFKTIAGSGKNGAIVHYRATKNNTRFINKNDIFLCDSGGQYKYGTTDVTRTICFYSQPLNIKNIFTKVLKGHIAVVQADLKKKFNGKLIDVVARKFLKQSG
jgi:Xaa-Pro aminopeptidase